MCVCIYNMMGDQAHDKCTNATKYPSFFPFLVWKIKILVVIISPSLSVVSVTLPGCMQSHFN